MMPSGLTSAQAEESRLENGSNRLTRIPPVPLWKRFISCSGEPMIVILYAAFAIQVGLFCLKQIEWYEPAGIFLAVLLSVGVSAVSENCQEKKASVMKAEEEAKEVTKLVRDGILLECHVDDAVVGDVVFLQTGDKIPADGVILEGVVSVDQSALNGETEEAEKHAAVREEENDPDDLLSPGYVYRGTVVCGGEAYMKIRVVGDRTIFGKLALEVQEKTRQTPLQVKLARLAKQIAAFGYVGAAAIITGILAKTCFSGLAPEDFYGWLRLLVDAVTVAVTIIVCAVPEGLPLLTSILMSMQSLRMAKDNVLVHKINGLETSGSLNLLYTDKTGTITEGRLSVVEVVSGDGRKYDCMREIPGALALDVVTALGLNNSSSVSGGSVIGGNSTDRAVMSFLVDGEVEKKINREEVLRFEPFDSEKKYSKVEVSRAGKTVVYLKGAPEKILDCCEYYAGDDGEVKPLTGKPELAAYLNLQASRSMRLLAAAKTETDGADSPLILICLLCIRDDVRKEVSKAIREVRDAGIQVVMITGDRKETAVSIAKDSGLLDPEKDVVLTSAGLANKSDDEVKKILPGLRVVARALPSDKSRLVRMAQEQNLVVGMTGDGVNDSPALKKADVGFAMGSGTEVAKEAGDITILDDNFLSIEKAILYGRTMFQIIRKFLVFQLTVNVAAVLICCIGPLLGENVVLTVVQLLIINLVMDTLVAIALGGEPALPEYMREKPVPRTAGIVSSGMFCGVIVNSAYITCICLAILFFKPLRDLFGPVDVTYLKSALFATFMMAIVINSFNARTNGMNLFRGLLQNRNFLVIMISIFIGQFLFVTFGGKIFAVESLSPGAWGICFAMAILIVPLDLLRKAVTAHFKKRT